MKYTLTLSLCGVLSRDMPTASVIARQVLEQRLGGPAGVELAFRAAALVAGPDHRVPAPADISAEDLAAVERWPRAVDTVFERLFAEFCVDTESPWFDEMAGEALLSVELLDTGAPGWRPAAPF